MMNNPNTYLETRPDFFAVLFVLGALLAVSLPLLSQLTLGVSVVFGAFLVLRLVLLIFGVYALKMWQTLLLLVGIMLLVWQQLGTLIGLQGGIAFLLMLSLLKSYEGQTRRDWQVLVLAMLFLVAGSVLFDQDLLTGLWAVVCLLLMALSLAVLNELPFRLAWRHSVTAFVLTLPVMAVLFVGVPRRESPIWGVPQPNKSATTGMSETMKAGSIGDLVQSNEPVFSATFDNGAMPQQGQLYWRVMILSEWENGAWHMMRDYTDTAEAVPTKQTISYQIIAEDEKGRLPALDYPLPFKKHGFGYEAGNVLRVLSRQGVRRVALKASLNDELKHHLHSGEKAYYTKLPENSHLQTKILAKSLYQQSGGNTEKFIALAYQYFNQQGFTYTLKPPVLSEDNSTDEFMFGSKQGFCEHYADAFTVMMRAAGIPARVVAGYQGGEYNSEDGFWQIRSKDAHAWTEVWIAEKNVWKRIDPTAAVAVTRIENGVGNALPDGEVSELIAHSQSPWTKYLDRSRFYWQQWVINYDSDRQQNLFGLLGFQKVSLGSVGMVLGVGLSLALLPMWLWWRRSRKHDVRPMEDGFLLLKQAVLGGEREDWLTLAPLELQHDYAEKLTPSTAMLLNEYIQLNYAQAQAPNQKVAQAWYCRMKKWAKKQQKLNR